MPPSSPSDDTPAWIKGDLPRDEPPPDVAPVPPAEADSAVEPSGPAEPAAEHPAAESPAAEPDLAAAEPPEITADELLAAIVAGQLSVMDTELNDEDEMSQTPAEAELDDSALESDVVAEVTLVRDVVPGEPELVDDEADTHALDDEDVDEDEFDDDEDDVDEDDEDDEEDDDEDDEADEIVLLVVDEPEIDGTPSDTAAETDGDVILVVVDAEPQLEDTELAVDEEEDDVDDDEDDEDEDEDDDEDEEDFDDEDEDDEEVEDDDKVILVVVEEPAVDDAGIDDSVDAEDEAGTDEISLGDAEDEPASEMGLPEAALMAELAAAEAEPGEVPELADAQPNAGEPDPAADEASTDADPILAEVITEQPAGEPERAPDQYDDPPALAASAAPALPPIEPPVVENLGLQALIESLLFVADGAVPVGRLAEALEVSSRDVEEALTALSASYQQRGLSVQRFRDKVQLTTSPSAAAKVERFLGLAAATPLSRAALEALAIVAYQQPVTRPQIEAVRGVNSDSVIKNLLTKGLIEESGRAEGPGRPVLYSTTPEFMQHFGLTSLEELPPLALPTGAAGLNPEQILKG